VTCNRSAEFSADQYAAWRASTLGAITESLEQRVILNLTGAPARLRFLDVGCGDGTLVLRIASMGAEIAVGCDLDLQMLARASAQPRPARSPAVFVAGRAECLPFLDAAFDVVTSIAVLCFLPDPPLAVREMQRVLKPGGRIVIGVLGRWSLWSASRRVRAWLGSLTWRGARFWTSGGARRLLEQSGLRVDRVVGAIFYPRLAIAARLLAPFDPLLGRVTTLGAAFIAVAATKPRDDRPDGRANQAP
jgi:ubiquinone/menaquinone biosynthesis C-methylase UbiE